MDAFIENLDMVLSMQPTRVVSSLTRAPAPGPGCQLLRLGHIACGSDYRIERQRYPGHEWLLCVRGRGRAHCGRARADCGPGDLLWLDNAQPHGHRADPSEPWELLWLRCSGPELSEWRRQLGWDRDLARPLAASAEWIAIWQRLAALGEATSHAQAQLEIHAGLTRLLELAGTAVTIAPADDELVDRCRLLLAADLARPWNSPGLARALGTAPSTLYRRFRAVTGSSPLAWLKRRRLEHAAQDLATSTRPIAAIAEGVGYADPFHFSRDFRRQFSVSPRAFRRAEGS